MQLQDIWLIFC